MHGLVTLSPSCSVRDLLPSSPGSLLFMNILVCLELLLCPCGFHRRTCRLKLFLGLLNNSSVQVHVVFCSRTSAGLWFAAFHRFFFLSYSFYAEYSPEIGLLMNFIDNCFCSRGLGAIQQFMFRV